MDVLLSLPSIKVFTAAIACLSRIAGSSTSTTSSSNTSNNITTTSLLNQDLYLEFDPKNGLKISTMNDAKTAYACITYQPSFFVHCRSNNHNNNDDDEEEENNNNENNDDLMTQNSMSSSTNSNSSNNHYEDEGGMILLLRPTFTCRITLKSLIPIIRYRKNIISLQIKSCCSSSSSNRNNNPNHKRCRSNNHSNNTSRNTNHNNNHDDDDDDEKEIIALEFIFTFRNYIPKENNNNDIDNHYNHQQQQQYHHNHQLPRRISIHRIPIIDTMVYTNSSSGNNKVHSSSTSSSSIMVLNPMHPKYSKHNNDTSMLPSQLVISPYILLRLLEPLQRTVEIALIVRNYTTTTTTTDNNNNEGNDDDNDDDVTLGTNTVRRNNSSNQTTSGSVSVSSFHHSDVTVPINDDTTSNENNNTSINNNAILQATTASLIKTETTCTSNEFVQFDFISKRRRSGTLNQQQQHDRERVDSNDMNNMPKNVNEEVILVFPIKETKAMLNFCCTTSSISSNGGVVGQQQQQQQQQYPNNNNNNIDPLVHVSFHWGGKPIMIQSSIPTPPTDHDNDTTDDPTTNNMNYSKPNYNMQLILATLDYRLLTSMPTMMMNSN